MRKLLSVLFLIGLLSSMLSQTTAMAQTLDVSESPIYAPDYYPEKPYGMIVTFTNNTSSPYEITAIGRHIYDGWLCGYSLEYYPDGGIFWSLYAGGCSNWWTSPASKIVNPGESVSIAFWVATEPSDWGDLLYGASVTEAIATPTSTATSTPTPLPTPTPSPTPTGTPEGDNTIGALRQAPPGEFESGFNIEVMPIPTADPELVAQLSLDWGVDDLNYIGSITATMMAFIEQQEYIFIGVVIVLSLWVLGRIAGYVTDAPKPGRVKLNVSGARHLVDDQIPDD